MKRRYVLTGKASRLWVRKRICERTGLIVRERTTGRVRPGRRSYLVEIPDDLPNARSAQAALRIRRQVRQHRTVRFMTGIANGLLTHAGRNSFWRDHSLARLLKPRAR